MTPWLRSDDLVAEEAGRSTEELRAALERLAEARHLVLRDGEVVMAHPFASVPLGFSVLGRSRSLGAGSNDLFWGLAP